MFDFLAKIFYFGNAKFSTEEVRILMSNIMNLKLILITSISAYFLFTQLKNMWERIKESKRVYKDDISYQQEQAVKDALEKN